jgi:riboflavin kinase/FMN adenylyltransferase
MRIIRGVRNIKKKIESPVVALGNFDGVHLGHQEIFRRVKERSGEVRGTSVVYTFDPHPLKVLSPDKSPPLLTTFHKKMELIRGCGIDTVICADFNLRFAALCPRDFAGEVLSQKIGAMEVFVGQDYTFGRQKEGTINYLKKMGEEFGFKVNIVEPVSVDGNVASSSLVRDLLEEGQVSQAARLLGRHYCIEGKIVEGFKTGAVIGYPTANLDPRNELVPQTGAYAVTMNIRGKSHDGVANIGYNPTFKRDRLSIEVHLFDFSKDLYSQEVDVCFIERIRDEREFSTSGELVKQIAKDIERAKEILDAKN